MNRSRFRFRPVFLATLGLAALWSATAGADSVTDFYKGRTVTIVVGYSAGGGYDAYARILARTLAKHIPGNPVIVTQNMPGAGSRKASLYMDGVAPKDGSTLATVGRSEGVAPLFEPDAKFNGTKFAWIGSITDENSVCIGWHTAPVKSWQDMLTTTFPVAAEGAGADPDMYSLAIRNLFGAKLKLITGYPGTNEMGLAIERGEVDGACGLSWRSIQTQHPDWIRDKKINVLVQIALESEPSLTSVPLITGFTTDPEKLQILKLIIASQGMARPFFAPPGIPEDRKQALRAAFDASMTDPEFLADAQRSSFAVKPMSGAAIEALLAELYATPKEVVAKAARAIAN